MKYKLGLLVEATINKRARKSAERQRNVEAGGKQRQGKYSDRLEVISWNKSVKLLHAAEDQGARPSPFQMASNLPSQRLITPEKTAAGRTGAAVEVLVPLLLFLLHGHPAVRHG